MARKTLLTTTTIPAAGTYTTSAFRGLAGSEYLLVEAVFVRAAGGTTLKAYVQTSLDNGVTWIDIMCFAFATTTVTKISKVSGNIALTPNTTPSDAALADNTILDGVIGDQVRLKYVVVGTYTGASTFAVNSVAK